MNNILKSPHDEYEGDFLMKKILFLSVSLIIGFLVFNKSEEIIIPMDAIRVRIIANSNNINDLAEKKKLKESIKADLFNLVSDAKNSDEAIKDIEKSMDKIKKIVSSKTSDYELSFGKNYFPKKVYKGVIYNEGLYDSLVIKLGKGLGDNWWCVLYPPLCMMEDNLNTSDVEYRSFVKDLLFK